MQPILDAVSEATGWAVTFLAGGPEPADGGDYVDSHVFRQSAY